MADLIDRQAAIDELVKMLSDCFYADEEVLDAVKTTLKELPPALREQHHDEWCTDCKEYDKEKHCCPRWNRVIRQTLQDAQPERKKGKWIEYEQEFMLEEPLKTVQKTVRECSVCTAKIAGMVGIMNYCPNCGAKMISEGKTCDCYSDGRCIGTKEIDPCSCGGVRSKCDFYENVRREGDAE